MASSSPQRPSPPKDDAAEVLAAAPAPDQLGLINDQIKELGEVARLWRDYGDDLAEYGAVDAAAGAYEFALRLEKGSLERAKRYQDFNMLFGADDRPLLSNSPSNYPLEGGEQTLAKLFCDRKGRTGGLLRRLGRLDEAQKFYDVGAAIEAKVSSLGVVNSYNTVNSLLIKIELGQNSASGPPDAPPGLRDEALKLLEFVERQEDYGRAFDAWLKADIGHLTMVIGGEENVDKALGYYEDYLDEAMPDDVRTTLRVLRLVEQKLKSMGDPIAANFERATDTMSRRV